MQLSRDNNLNSCCDLLRSSVIKHLNRRLFHKLNNVICIATTNLELLRRDKIAPDFTDYRETIEETGQAINKFTELINDVSYFLRCGQEDMADHSSAQTSKRFSALIASGILVNLSFEMEGFKTQDHNKDIIDSLFLSLFMREKVFAQENEFAVSIKEQNGSLVTELRGSPADNYNEKLKSKSNQPSSDIDSFLIASFLEYLRADLSIENKGKDIIVSVTVPSREVNHG